MATREWPTANVKPCRPAWSSRAIASATRRVGDVVDRGAHHHDLARRVRRMVGERRDRAGRRRPRRALGGGQHAGAPVVLRGGEVVRPHDHDGRAALEVQPDLGGPRRDLGPVGERPVEDPAHEGLLRRGRRALRRAQALDLRGDQRRHDAQEGGRRLARPPAQPQAPDHLVADPQLVRGHAGHVGHQRALVGGRARRDGQHGARRIHQHQRRLERPRGRADDLGQPHARLDGVGDRLERIEVDRRADVRAHGHPGQRSDRPAGFRRVPDATARRSTRGRRRPAAPRRARRRPARRR